LACDVRQFVGVQDIVNAPDLPIRYIERGHIKQLFTRPQQNSRATIDILKSKPEISKKNVCSNWYRVQE
jgi:hypothetical protein